MARQRLAVLVLATLLLTPLVARQVISAVQAPGLPAAAQAIETSQPSEPWRMLAANERQDPAAIEAAGLEALAAGRNDATLAALLKIRLSAKDLRVLERDSGLVSSANPDLVAAGLLGVEQAATDLHQTLIRGMPSKLIVVSVAGQELTAYDHGKLVQDALVTTGRPSLPTDIGLMHVLRKSSPFTMHSPWPKSSPWWYPDTVVQMVLWFTNTGEGMHDAYWEPAGAYGPGSTTGPFASHGCIHVPYSAVLFLFHWAPLGTPVIVYPGDGTPVTAQLKQVTVDQNGDPISSINDLRGD